MSKVLFTIIAITTYVIPLKKKKFILESFKGRINDYREVSKKEETER